VPAEDEEALSRKAESYFGLWVF